MFNHMEDTGMNSKFAKWGLSQLLMLVMLVAAGSAFAAAGDSLLHNSNNLGTKYGTWGVTGGTYGQFSCATCHNKTTNNVKRVEGSILTKSVTFNNMTGFGDDSISRSTSFRVCEVCHTQTKYHQYNNTAQSGGLTHPNGDCTSCHKHSDAFRPSACDSCHGHNAASSNPIVTGQHAAHTNNVATLGVNFSCAACHAPTVSDDTTFSNAANHNNGVKNYGGTNAGAYTAGTGNCTATCHTDGKGGVPATAVNWNAGPALDCKGCHGGGTSQAGEPVYTSGAAGSATANTHPKHVGTTGANATCQNCHGATMSGTGLNASGKHADMTIDVVQGNSKTFTYTVGTKTCSTSSCHGGNGIFTPAAAQWGATLNCNGCHGGPAALGSNILASGKHTAHINNGNLGAFGCVECHAKTVSSDTVIGTPAMHLNNIMNYSGAKAGKSSTYAAGNCSATYCHTDGKGTAKSMAANLWTGATTLDCKGCHGSDASPAFTSVAGEPNYTNAGANLAKSNSHQKHTTAGASSCVSCHGTTVDAAGAILAGGIHIDKAITVVQGGTATLTYGANKTCSTSSCHSGGGIVASVAAAQWGATLNCNGCHGGPAALGSNILASGKHTAHINNGNLGAFGCVECHAKTVSSDTVIGTPAMHLNNIMNYSGAKAGKSSTYAAGNCSATYCHTDGKGTAKSMAANLWTGATTLDCKGCHGSDASPAFTSVAGEPNYTNAGANLAKSNSHQKHTTAGASSCVSCHGTTVDAAGAILAGGIHIDKAITVVQGGTATLTYGANKTCSTSSCHSGGGIVASVAAAQWGATLNCNGCHGGPAALGSNILASGKHTAHINNGNLGAFGCVECHAKTVSSDTVIGTPAMHLNNIMNYSGAKAGKSSTYAAGNCSATYCHTDGKGTAKSMAANLWTGATTLDCKGCHGSDASPAFTSVAGEPNYTNAGANLAKSNSHQKHTTAGASSCVSCHGTTVDAAGAILAGGIHIDKAITVVQGGTATLTYGANKTCSTSSCHSGGGIVSGVAAAQWGATLDCAGCHGNKANAATKLSGAHNSHLNSASTGGNFSCVDCHANTVSSDTVISNTANHMNSLKNFSGAKAGKNVTCATIYCHSNGRGSFAVIPTWTSGTNLDCNGCHGSAAAPLSTNYAHTTHVVTKGFTCNYCHSATTTNGTSITGSTHIDGSVNIQVGASLTFNSKSVSFTGAGTTCSNISCHSPGAGANAGTATWGVKATCETCHPKAGLSGNHAVHMGALTLTDSAILYNMTANRTPVANDTVKQYGFGCASCHPMDIANHLNGSIDVDMGAKVAGVGTIRFLNSTTAGQLPSYSSGACSNIYCHSNASRVATELVYKPTPAWVGGSFTGDRCAACHANQPVTGAHSAHAVGNHTDNIYNGKNGKIATSGRANTAHGNPDNSTTIGCYICHQGTVTSKANDLNVKCVGCHYSGNTVGATLKGVATIANLKNHVNGTREIQFLAVNVKSKAQIRNESFNFYSGVWQRSSYKNMSTLSYDTAKVALDTASMWHPGSPMQSSCTNVACHNLTNKFVKYSSANGKGIGLKPVFWNLANWNDANKCMDCHDKL